MPGAKTQGKPEGFEVVALELQPSGSFGVESLGLLGFRVQGLGFKVQGF